MLVAGQHDEPPPAQDVHARAPSSYCRRTYVAAVKLAKAYPDRAFTTGLTTWWSTTASEIMPQFNGEMMECINAKMSSAWPCYGPTQYEYEAQDDVSCVGSPAPS